MVESDRELALDIALWASRLLQKEYFDDACNAIKEEDQEKFFATCRKAKIPNDNDLHLKLYNMIREGYATNCNMVWP